MSTAFRRAAAADIPLILDLMAGLYAEDGVVELRRGPAEAALRDLVGSSELGAVWVAEVGGVIVGYLAVTWGFSLEHHGRDAFIDELYVAPAHRGRGIGRQALAVAEAACRTRGVRALHLEVEGANLRAQELYRRGGFLDQDRRLMTRPL
jgi:ribosomal protein S18 acetylase RimI-like enzyme